MMKVVLQPNKTSHALILGEKPIPVPSHPEDVLVKVHATSPCKGELDWALFAPDFILPDKIPIPGPDVAGTVIHSPTDSKFKIGDAVYARIEANRPGAAAEYTLVRETELAIKPNSLSWVEAAACPLSSLTAYQALFTQGALDRNAFTDEAVKASNANLHLLVTSGSSSVGTWVIQLAHQAGVGNITAISSTRNISFVRGLGATEVIDYTNRAFTDGGSVVPEVDIVIDTIGGSSLKQAWELVKDGGEIISICADPEQSRQEGSTKKVKNSFFIVKPDGHDLEIISELIEAGRVKPTIDSVVEFDDFEKAWEKVESGHTRGKVVVKVSGEV